MAIGELVGALEREAAAERAAVLARAREEAARLTSDAESRVAQARAAAATAAERRERDAMAIEAAAARRRTRAAVLEARASLLDQVFAEAGRRLPGAARSHAYRATLAALFAEARAFAGTSEDRIEAPGVLADELGGAGVDFRADDSLTGFRFVSADGALVVDATLAGQLERRRGALAQVVVAAIEAGA